MPAMKTLEERQEKQRAKWRRNKRDERQRLRDMRSGEETNVKTPSRLQPEFLRQVWAERDKRLRNFPMHMPHLPERRFFKNSSNFASQSLVCDIWAAEVIMGTANPNAKITDGEIAKFLVKEGRTHGVTPASLRTKVWRSRPIVRFLEEAPIWNQPGKYWPKFPESMPELGSGLQQHVDKVMAIVEAINAQKTRDRPPSKMAPTAEVAADVFCDRVLIADEETRLFRILDGFSGLGLEELRNLPALLEFGPIGLVKRDRKHGWLVV